MMLSPCGAAYSLDARRVSRRRGTLAEPLIVPWAQRLLQLQLCLIYLAAAAFKCHGSTWLGGTAIHFVLFNREFGQGNLQWLADYPAVIGVLTYSALITEFSLAFLLWFRPTRKWIALAGVLLHAGIVPLVNVPLFGEQMTALYLLFLAPDELARLLAFLDPRRWFSTQGRELPSLSARLDPAHGPLTVGASSSSPLIRPTRQTASARLSDVSRPDPPATGVFSIGSNG